MQKYGFIGLGSQGAPMARRMIEAGLEVVLWARREETLEPFRDSGASFASSVGELGEQVDYCAICVVDDAGVRQVVDQLLPRMSPGGVLVIHATVHPELCKALARTAAEQGIALVDAPVSGGGEGAANGTLTVMLGGEQNTVDAVRPVLETFAGTIVHLGDVGAGQTAKLVNNTLMAANVANAWHALETAAALGIDRAALADLVRVSSGRSFGFEVCARMPQPSAFEHGARLLAKDVRLLGETIGEQEDYDILRRTAHSFLDRALAD
ncbi:NAD(P)-dependent oxidoreductase [Haliea sp. E17]|uniref:NAD(P)-dependent oxidoreductase n=1 Tax=Haliea sp. E17 TaxID=3401576 RepID=UPI003AAF0CCE